MFDACGCPVADVVVTEAVVDTLCEAMEAVVVGSSVLVVCSSVLVVCSSVFVVLAPLTAPCNGKTTLCV